MLRCWPAMRKIGMFLKIAMRNVCDLDSRCSLACDASARDAKSLAMWVERCEPLRPECFDAKALQQILGELPTNFSANASLFRSGQDLQEGPFLEIRAKPDHETVTGTGRGFVQLKVALLHKIYVMRSRPLDQNHSQWVIYVIISVGAVLCFSGLSLLELRHAAKKLSKQWLRGISRPVCHMRIVLELYPYVMPSQLLITIVNKIMRCKIIDLLKYHWDV